MILGTLVSRGGRIVCKLIPGLSHMMASRLNMEMTDTISKYASLQFLQMKYGTVAQNLKENTVTIYHIQPYHISREKCT
jgi:hypothetical protein